MVHAIEAYTPSSKRTLCPTIGHQGGTQPSSQTISDWSVRMVMNREARMKNAAGGACTPAWPSPTPLRCRACFGIPYGIPLPCSPRSSNSLASTSSGSMVAWRALLNYTEIWLQSFSLRFRHLGEQGWRLWQMGSQLAIDWRSYIKTCPKWGYKRRYTTVGHRSYEGYPLLPNNPGRWGWRTPSTSTPKPTTTRTTVSMQSRWEQILWRCRLGQLIRQLGMRRTYFRPNT